jgi:hypothetical protein
LAEHTRQAVARSYRDAADVLESGDLSRFTCCGHPLTEYGTCRFRSHPTPAHSEILSYPEYYDEEGRYCGD